MTWLPRYMQQKRLKGRKFIGFWEPLWAEWFAKHPLPPLTAEEVAAGVDQGDRKGERRAKMQKVSEVVLYFINDITHHSISECMTGLEIIAGIPLLAPADMPCWI